MSDTLKKTASLTAEQKRALLARLLREKEKEREKEKAGGSPPERSCAPRLFEAQAARTPEAIAVVDARGGALTFGALDLRAGRLARLLREQGAGAGTLVALCAGRSSDLVVALLAILKAGAAYLPLDPEYPGE